MTQEIRRFEAELKKGSEMNPKRIYNKLKEVIEERVHLKPSKMMN